MPPVGTTIGPVGKVSVEEAEAELGVEREMFGRPEPERGEEIEGREMGGVPVALVAGLEMIGEEGIPPVAVDAADEGSLTVMNRVLVGAAGASVTALFFFPYEPAFFTDNPE